jgi:hypothetical protein
MVAKHLAELLAREPDPYSRDLSLRVASVTGCLPIYEDMGGTILLAPSGDLFFYDDGSETMNPVEDRVWENIALVSLAKKYPDLAEVLPVRPENAVDCPLCLGTGRVTSLNLLCGECGGTGWRDEGGEQQTQGNGCVGGGCR